MIKKRACGTSHASNADMSRAISTLNQAVATTAIQDNGKLITINTIFHVKQSHRVNLNPYQLIGDFMLHLNLLDNVIYPLMYSNLFTVHGVQYFNKNTLGEKVYFNLIIRDVLFTTLLRRGIEVIQDKDNQP